MVGLTLLLIAGGRGLERRRRRGRTRTEPLGSGFKLLSVNTLARIWVQTAQSEPKV